MPTPLPVREMHETEVKMLSQAAGSERVRTLTTKCWGTSSIHIAAGRLPPTPPPVILFRNTWPLGWTACHSQWVKEEGRPGGIVSAKIGEERRGEERMTHYGLCVFVNVTFTCMSVFSFCSSCKTSLLFRARPEPNSSQPLRWAYKRAAPIPQQPPCPQLPMFLPLPVSPCLPVPWGCRFLVQQPGTRPPLTAGLCRGHVGQKAQHAVPALRQGLKQMLQGWRRRESSGRCH